MIYFSNTHNKLTTKHRLKDIDSVKGFLILLICLSNALHILPQTSSVILLSNILYLFNIHLFVFFSGMFSKKFSVKRISFIFISFVVYCLLTDYPNLTSLVQMLRTPPAFIWYLECLIFWKLMILPLEPSFIRYPKTTLTTILLISLTCGYLPYNINEYNISRTLTYFPFFVLGYFVTWSKTTEFIDCISFKKLCLWLAAISYLFIFANLTYFKIYLIFFNKYNYYHTPYSEYAIFFRIYQFMAATVISIFILKIFAKQNSPLSILGKYSLLIYIGSSFILNFFLPNS